MGRLPYLGCMVAIFVANVLISVVFGQKADTSTTNPMVLVLALGLICFAIYCHVKRAQDIGKSGWFVLWLFVPIVNIGIFFYLLLKPSA